MGLQRVRHDWATFTVPLWDRPLWLNHLSADGHLGCFQFWPVWVMLLWRFLCVLCGHMFEIFLDINLGMGMLVVGCWGWGTGFLSGLKKVFWNPKVMMVVRLYGYAKNTLFLGVLCGHMFEILLDINLGMEFLGHAATLHFTFWRASRLFSKIAAPFYRPTSSVYKFQFLFILSSLPTLKTCFLSIG